MVVARVQGTSDPTSIQVHLLKLFDNVKSFGFSRGNKGVVSMESAEGEAYDVRTASPVGCCRVSVVLCVRGGAS